jgi:hypothetical protein
MPKSTINNAHIASHLLVPHRGMLMCRFDYIAFIKNRVGTSRIEPGLRKSQLLLCCVAVCFCPRLAIGACPANKQRYEYIEFAWDAFMLPLTSLFGAEFKYENTVLPCFDCNRSYSSLTSRPTKSYCNTMATEKICICS